jgi:GrpB-like predicted nucleotidyltransferase (UPF0157 family)
MPVVQSYDPDWARRGEQLGGEFKSMLGPRAVRVEHIGSTAIPGMAAKPTLDLQVSVRDLAEAQAAFDAPLAAMGLERVHWKFDHIPAGYPNEPGKWEKRLWARRSPESERINLHCRLLGSPNERLALLFRDWFRAHPLAVPAYTEFKLRLARVVDDLDVYTEIKDPIVDLVMVAAEQWAAATEWQTGTPPQS